jgi:hypothetical protein
VIKFQFFILIDRLFHIKTIKIIILWSFSSKYILRVKIIFVQFINSKSDTDFMNFFFQICYYVI